MVRHPRALIGRVAVAALVIAGLAVPMSSASAATATVGNGLTTTDLNAIGMSPNTLASALVGSGVTVSNVTYSGSNAQAGTIHVVDPAVVSFNDGIVLSTGNIADVVGPNKSDSTTGDMAGPGDADLTALIANTQTVNPATYDAASLEFDFVPSASQVYFTYTFASDEYLEWVNLFNDVFAFYVNGTNCATLPNGDPVSIDTINSVVNPNLFRDNSFSNPPANPLNFESDGLSVEMICSAPVNAGQTNHMKLAIADTSDQVLDSVVMIKAQSLSTTKPESCNDGIDNNDDTYVDMNDPSCQSTTSPAPVGLSGTGSANQAPAFTGNEGNAIPLDASILGWTASSDTVSTSWTVNGINGTVGTCDISPAGPQALNSDGSIAIASALCPSDGEYVARVEGLDAEGQSAFDYDVDFFVHNAPPDVAITDPGAVVPVAVGPLAQASAMTSGPVQLSGSVGVPVQVSATIIDPGMSDSATCQLSWGDGSSEPGTISAGICTGSHIYAQTGVWVLAVTATDNAGATAAALAVVTINIAPADTTLSSNANPSVKGQPVTVTATTILGTTGKMTFYDGTTLIGTKTVVGGSATLIKSNLTVGSHPLSAVYKKTPTATPSTSTTVDQQVDPASTTTTVTSTQNPSVFGQSTTIKATVAPLSPGTGAPTGSVDFYDNQAPVAHKTLVAGRASFAVKPAVGTHTYTAVYSPALVGGTYNYAASSTDAGLDQVVNPAGSAVALVSQYPTTTFHHAGSITATVSAASPGSGKPTGSVTFYVDGFLASTVQLVSGRARLLISSLAVGNHTITATYSGSINFNESTTLSGLTQTIN